MVGNFVFQLRVKYALLFVPIFNIGLNHYHSSFVTVAVVGLVHHRRVYPEMYPRAVHSRRPGAICVEAVFLVFMASAMTSHHYLTSHSEKLALSYAE